MQQPTAPLVLPPDLNAEPIPGYELLANGLPHVRPATVCALEDTGLLLTGGGARAAYQVGVLEALADLRRAAGQGQGPNPFPIITGTSAGAINAAALAGGADDFDGAVRRIAEVWRNFRAEQVYHTGSLGVVRSGASWLTLLSLGWMINKWRRVSPRSLLDNTPLRTLLEDMVPLKRIPALIGEGHLRALAVTASSYSSGEHVTFFQGSPELRGWNRSQRYGIPHEITIDHLLASSAIPFVFPAMPLAMEHHTEFFGDGSMRQSAPIAPAIHFGAQRILVVGAGRMHEPKGEAPTMASNTYPSMAQIAGHALSNIFLDALSVDVERVQRVNRTLKLIPPQAQKEATLRPIELLIISPSERVDVVAARHVKRLPPTVRAMLGGMGVSSRVEDARGAALASYLLFEAEYTQELMAMGYADTCRQSAEVCAFFGWPDTRLQPAEARAAVAAQAG